MNDELDRFLAHARGSAQAAKVLSLDELRARRGATTEAAANASWGLAALRGRLVELSARGATATLTTAIEIVCEAQTQAEPVAWIALANGTFYPPDVADSGVDLSALVVVRAPDSTAAARAAERCLRSGAFGLVILDLTGQSESGRFHSGLGSAGDLSMQIQGRLVTLAQTHDAAVLCLTEKNGETASIGSLVSLRAEALRTADRSVRPDFAINVRVLKDKRRGPGHTQMMKRRGPAGLT